MAEEKQPTVDEILKQIEEFEKTIKELTNNIKTLKDKLLRNKKMYGSDMSKWPLK